jgi:hypothetical protein
MSRIVASINAAYDNDSYEIIGRVYRSVSGTSTHRIIVRLCVDGQIRATYRDTCQGLYWARKTMMEMVTDMHGAY